MNQNHYSETILYRCLDEHFAHQTDDIYLTMCGIEQCQRDKGMIRRVRDGYHLHVILSGKGILETENSRQTLHAGQMFLLKPGEKIGYQPVQENPWAYCWMSFNGARAKDYMLQAAFDEGIYVRDTHVDTSKFYSLCDQVLKRPQLSQSQAVHRLGLLLQFISLAIESAEIDLQHDGRRDYLPTFQKGEYIQHAVQFIETNYSSINIADVSRYLGIDRSYFASIFKQSKGISPNEYLLQVRMKESSYMLRNLEMSIQEIACYVGYEDPLTFSKAFKRFFGISPKFYRTLPEEERPTLDAAIEQRRNTGNEE